MTVLDEMKVSAYYSAIDNQERIVKTYEELIMTRDTIIKYPSLQEYRKAIVLVERYRQLIREITGEEITS